MARAAEVYSRILCQSTTKVYVQPPQLAAAYEAATGPEQVPLLKHDLRCTLSARHITSHAAQDPNNGTSLLTWPLTAAEVQALAQRRPPMWQVTARDESGRIWMTFYEGGVQDGVRDAFTRHLPSGLVASSVQVAEVESE